MNTSLKNRIGVNPNHVSRIRLKLKERGVLGVITPVMSPQDSSETAQVAAESTPIGVAGEVAGTINRVKAMLNCE
jgi:hypothetical protein